MRITRRQLRRLINEVLLNEGDFSSDRMTGGGAESFGKAHTGFLAIPDEEFAALGKKIIDSDAMALALNIQDAVFIPREDIAKIQDAYDEMVDSYQQAAKTLAEGKGDKGSWERFWYDAAYFLVLATAFTGFAIASAGYSPLKVFKKLMGPLGGKLLNGLKKQGVKPPKVFTSDTMQPMVAEMNIDLLNKRMKNPEMGYGTPVHLRPKGPGDSY